MDDYPVGHVRLVEPFGAGGGPDLTARALAGPLSELWRKPVTVENRPGAGSTAGAALVATSPADGHTLLLSTSAHAYGAAVAAALPYDPLRDFVPVVPLTSQPYVLVAGSGAGAKTLAGLIAAARAEPGVLRFGSAGVGTATHIGVEQLNREAGIDAVHVPAHRADAIADAIGHTIAGRTDYALSPIAIAVPHIHERRLVALGVSTSRRSRLLPEVPTLSEAGVAGFDFPIWYGIWAPAGTPARTVDVLAESFARVLEDPALRAWLGEHDADLLRMAPGDFAEFVLAESRRAARIVDSRERS